MWGFGEIQNTSDQILMVDYAVGPGANTTGTALNGTAGNAILEIGSLGALYFTDMGHQDGGPHNWAVDVAYNDNTWRWFYDGQGVLDVGVATGGVFVLAGAGQELRGQLVQPPGPPADLAAVLDLDTMAPLTNAGGTSPRGD